MAFNRGQGGRRTSPFHHRLRIEPLEDRRLLSVTADSLDVFRQTASADWDSFDPGVVTIDLACLDYSVESIDGYGDRLTAAGLTTGGDTGEPELPQRTIRVALPSDADLASVTLSIATAEPTVLRGRYDLGPGPVVAAYSESGAVVSGSPGVTLIDGRNPGVYSTDANLDPVYCELVSTQQLGRYKIVELAYSPFDYNPVTGRISVIQNGTLTVTFDTDDPLPAELLASNLWDDDAADVLVNGEDAVAMYDEAAAAVERAAAEGAGTANYVIITTADIVAGSTQLSAFVTIKELLGYTVEVVTETDWGGGTGDAAAENLRAWLQANYAAMGIEYVLLVGDPHPATGDVPMKMTWPCIANPDTPDSPTDLYYAELTSDWDVDGDGLYGEWGGDFNSYPLQEVIVGRIPVYNDNYSDLDAILAKTIDYSTELNGDWRQSMILPMAVAFYDNENGNDYAAIDGDEIGQAIVNDLAVPHGYDYFTLYEKAGLAPVPTACDAPLTKDDLLNQWAADPPGIVAWSGHGSPTGAHRRIWTTDSNANGRVDSGEFDSPTFITSDDVGRLDNTHPAIVIQASCLNGRPENSNNLGYSLLLNGGIATISASRAAWVVRTWSLWGHSFTPTWGDAPSYDYAVTKELISDPQTISVGRALQLARQSFTPPSGFKDMIWQNETEFNLYGDPSIRLGTVLPAAVEGTVFEDTDLDGTQQPGEPGVLGATVYLDTNGNGRFEPTEPHTTTDADGAYEFTDMRVGTHQVGLVAPDGWAQYSPDWGTTQAVSLWPDAAVTDCDFGIGPGSTVSGYVWHDLNANGDPDTGELGLNGWTVFVDTDGNGSLDNGEFFVVTHDDLQSNPGYYELSGLAAGDYAVCEVRQTGWTQTDPADPGVRSLHLSIGQDVSDAHFGNYANPGSISGYVWSDLDADGDWDAAEPGLNGWTVFIDANSNGGLDAGELSTTTHDDALSRPGYYEFAGLAAGTYAIAEAPPIDWAQTSPAAPGSHSVPLAVGHNVGGLNFGNLEDPCSISGFVWNDLDGDGTQDAGEPGMNGWRVYLDADENGRFDAGEVSVATHNDAGGQPGCYEFTILPAGDYQIAAVENPGWTQVSPGGAAGQSITLLAGQSASGVAFGNVLTPGVIVVSTLADPDGGSDLSLREALALAAGISGPDTIVFDPTLAGGTITLDPAAGTLMVDSDVTIHGIPDAAATTGVDERITISGGGACGVMAVTTGVTAELNSLILTEGNAVNGAGLRIESSADVELAGMKIGANAATGNGGGLHVQNASLSLVDCEVTGNTTSLAGGGLYGYGATISISNSSFTGNTCPGVDSGCWGAGLCAEAASLVTISGSSFEDNFSGRSGGGLDVTGAGTQAWVVNSSFSNNRANGRQGGAIIVSSNAHLFVEACSVTDNQAYYYGGGIYVLDATATVLRTTVSGNRATSGAVAAYGAANLTISECEITNNTCSEGGGVCVRGGATVRVSGTTIGGNHALIDWQASSGQGGAVNVLDSTLVITNSVIVENSAEKSVGGVFVKNGTATLTNVTVAGNTEGNASYGCGVHSDGSSNVTLHNTVVASHVGPDIMGPFNAASSNNLIGVAAASTTGIAGGVNGNLVGTAASPVDPGFADAASGNYDLESTSRCVNHGNNSRLPLDLDDLDGDGDTSEPVPFDLAGKPRIIYATVDVGAYEYRLLGDANGDDLVDEKDASIVGSHWRQAGGWSDGDFSGDGQVDDRDAAILAAHWQQIAPGTLPGDANYDRTVDDRDAAILGSHWLQAGGWPDGDFNADGRVDDRDAAILAAHWGQTAEAQPAAETTSPPDDEPVVAADPRLVGPRPLSVLPAARRRIEPYRPTERVDASAAGRAAPSLAAACDAALAEPIDDAEILGRRLAWSSEFARPRHRRPLSRPDVAQRHAIDLVMMGY